MAKAFRLQRVLEHREQIELVQQGVVTQARLATERAQEALTALHDSDASEAARRAALARGAVDMGDTTRSQAYREYLEVAIEAQDEEVVELRGALHDEERALLTRRQERRALEKLRERHEAQIAEEARRADTWLMDEIATGRTARKASG